MPARPTSPDGSGAWRARRETASRAATSSSSFALITVVAFADGGYFPEAWLWTTLALACLVWVVLLLRDEIVLGLLDLAAIAAVAVFVGWVGASALWSPDPHISVDEAERGLVYVAAVMAQPSGSRSARRTRTHAYSSFPHLDGAHEVVNESASAARYLVFSTKPGIDKCRVPGQPEGSASARAAAPSGCSATSRVSTTGRASSAA